MRGILIPLPRLALPYWLDFTDGPVFESAPAFEH
jgi:hypothetical protein